MCTTIHSNSMCLSCPTVLHRTVLRIVLRTIHFNPMCLSCPTQDCPKDWCVLPYTSILCVCPVLHRTVLRIVLRIGVYYHTLQSYVSVLSYCPTQDCPKDWCVLPYTPILCGCPVLHRTVLRIGVCVCPIVLHENFKD